MSENRIPDPIDSIIGIRPQQNLNQLHSHPTNVGCEGDLDEDVEEAGDVDLEPDEAADDGRVPAEVVQATGQPVPYSPSDTEVRHHNLTHLPFRSWCAVCVKGKAKAGPHHHVDTHTNAGVPVISIDYAFICDTDD